MFRNLDLFPSSGEGRETPTPLSPVGRTNLKHWTWSAQSKGTNRVGVSLPSPEDGNRSRFRNAVLSAIWNSIRWTKCRNPVILSVIQHCQNPYILLILVCVHDTTAQNTTRCDYLSLLCDPQAESYLFRAYIIVRDPENGVQDWYTFAISTYVSKNPYLSKLCFVRVFQ
jgi:hypothetical protein